MRFGMMLLLAVLLSAPVAAQEDFRVGSRVPVELNALFSRGATYLEKTQNEDGSWPSENLFQSNGTGVCSLCILALLSTGEDPNFGPHSTPVRRGLEFLLSKQNQKSGMVGGNAYDFGFTMLALAECYGAVDEDRLFPNSQPSKRRTIARGLELCVKAASTMKSKTELVGHAWNSTAGNAGIPDTSVGGSVLIGLLAARNAGIEVPDHIMDRAFKYFRKMTSPDGSVGYFQTRANNYGNSIARSSIVALVLSIGKRKDSEEYASTRKYLLSNIEKRYEPHPLYGEYYQAQALFQIDYKAWQRWTRDRMSRAVAVANEDGSIGNSRVGKSYATAMNMLTLALNYRFLPIYER